VRHFPSRDHLSALSGGLTGLIKTFWRGKDLTYGIVMGCALAALFALLHKAVHEEGD